MRYKALLLDFYGTLVADDDRLVFEIAQEIVAASPLTLDVKQVSQAWYEHMERISLAESFRTLRQIEIDSLTLLFEQLQTQLGLSALTRRIFAYWSAPDVVPNAREFIYQLQQQALPVCIVSDVDTSDLESALRHAGWQFANRVTSEECRVYKPRPEIFERALTLLNCQPNEVLHVGDSWASDVRGAQALGIDVAWVNRDRRPQRDDTVQPTFIVTDLRELYPILGFTST